jgi:hypothetical protein
MATIHEPKHRKAGHRPPKHRAESAESWLALTAMFLTGLGCPPGAAAEAGLPPGVAAAMTDAGVAAVLKAAGS